jgi:tetratricopeptide (TPR) repeat protein
VRVGTIVAVFVLLAAASVHADGRDEAREAARKAAIRYEIGEFKEALELFKEAYKSFDEPSLLFNIAQCYRQLDDKVNAVRIYRSYLIKLPKAPNRDEVRSIIAKMEKLIQEEQSTRNAPPEGTLRAPNTTEARPSPAPLSKPPVAARPAPPPPVAAQPLTVTATRPSAPTPIYKKWWLWTAVGAVVVTGVGLGLGLGLTAGGSAPAPTAPTTFGTARPF